MTSIDFEKRAEEAVESFVRWWLNEYGLEGDDEPLGFGVWYGTNNTRYAGETIVTVPISYWVGGDDEEEMSFDLTDIEITYDKMFPTMWRGDNSQDVRDVQDEINVWFEKNDYDDLICHRVRFQRDVSAESEGEFLVFWYYHISNDYGA